MCNSLPHPLDLGQSVDGVLDGVGGDDVRVVTLQVILARPERELNVRLQLDDGVAAPLPPDDQHLHRVFAVARPHKLHVLRTTTKATAPHNSAGLIMCAISRLLRFVPNTLEADVFVFFFFFV